MQNQSILLYSFLLTSFLMPVCTSGSRDNWQLPFKIGDPKSIVYSSLGEPTDLKGRTAGTGEFIIETDEVEWYRDKGIAVSYYTTGHVSSITLHGEFNNWFTPYKGYLFSGLRITDSLGKFKDVLGSPVSIEKSALNQLLDYSAQQIGSTKEFKEESRVYKWKMNNTLIEAEFWVNDYTERGQTFKAGTLKELDLQRGNVSK